MKKLNPLFCEKFKINCFLSLLNCCIKTSQVTQMTIASITSPVSLLSKNVYFMGHFMNGLCFICPFAGITATG